MSWSAGDVNGFCPILSIFYAAFHPTEGSKVLAQVPTGSIISPTDAHTDSSALSSPLFQFDWVKNYVIPKPQLCNRLVTCKVGNYRIVGYPVFIYDSEYERNSFVFNFAFVFPGEAVSTVYEMPIRRLARMFMVLEEQNKFLSKPSSLGKIGNIIDQIYQDLNNYSECMIPIDESNTVNMKLFPLFPPPPDLEGHHVPISTVRLAKLMDENWDPTMEKIVPFINGINSIQRISQLAAANYLLTKQCIQHLIHYRCLIIVDLFQFSNIYATTASISTFLSDPEMFLECQMYVFSPEKGRRTSNTQLASSFSSSSSYSSVQKQKPPSQVTLFFLYKSLHQGQTIKEWYMEHKKLLQGIDVRRLLSFGVIKGLIYRVHSYPICESGTRRRHLLNKEKPSGLKTGFESFLQEEVLDQPKHFDAICTKLGTKKSEVEQKFREDGDWTIVNA